MVGRAQTWLALALAGAAIGCGDFEAPEQVIDLRLLAITAEPAEQLVPIGNPSEPTVDLDDIDPIEVCALVADPGDSRGLTYQYQLCPPTDNGRCDDEDMLIVDLATGDIGDPEEAADAQTVCATIPANLDLVVLLMQASQTVAGVNELLTFNRLSFMAELAVWPVGGSRADAQFGTKRITFSIEIPGVPRVPNQNPALIGLTGARAATGVRGADLDMPVGRCNDGAGVTAAAGERLTIVPDEANGAREDYIALDENFNVDEIVTESLHYHWYATHGSFSRFTSGGFDPVGDTVPPGDTVWTAPDDAAVIGAGLDVRLWTVVRDERGGGAFYESCVRVLP